MSDKPIIDLGTKTVTISEEFFRTVMSALSDIACGYKTAPSGGLQKLSRTHVVSRAREACNKLDWRWEKGFGIHHGIPQPPISFTALNDPTKW